MFSLVVSSFLLCSSIRSLYTGVLLHEPENSLILLRAQQNKGVFFVCSLSGMVKEDDGLMRIRSRDIALELLEETNT